MLCPPSLSTPCVPYILCTFAAIASVVSARVVIVIAVVVLVVVWEKKYKIMGLCCGDKATRCAEECRRQELLH